MRRRRVLVYKRFERFWHWLQAGLIVMLAITGFEVHGSIDLFGFERAVVLHDRLALGFFVLVVFAIFWHFTTGEWRQYLPTFRKLPEMVRFYMRGIFRAEPHPVKKTELSKLNPLQRLTYLALKLVLIPLQVISGFIYFKSDSLAPGGSPGTVALIHTAGSFALVVFLVVHVYMTTTGRTVFSNLVAMITGREIIEDAEDEGQGAGGGPSSNPHLR